MFYAIIGLHCQKLGLAALGLLGLKLKTAWTKQSKDRFPIYNLLTDWNGTHIGSHRLACKMMLNTTYIRLTAMLNCPASAVADYALPNISSYAIRLHCLQRERRDFLRYNVSRTTVEKLPKGERSIVYLLSKQGWIALATKKSRLLTSRQTIITQQYLS